jgi:hypothetical protein
MTVKNYYPVWTRSWRATGVNVPTFISMTALAVAFVCSLAAPALAMPGDPSRFRPGLRNSPEPDKLSEGQLDILKKSLREKTGFLEMRFDEDGFLVLGDRTRIAGGSATARALLVATVDGAKTIFLRNRRRASEVAFARLGVSTIYMHLPTGTRVDAYSLEVDFSDFDQLRGDREAIAAFDLGLVALHELAHAVLSLEDDRTNTQGLGDCEAFINRIRRELRLPERQRYIARERKTIYGVRTAEIHFTQRTQANTRRFYLSWESDLVGRIGGR